MGQTARVTQETLAISMVGDGVVAGLFAGRHVALWDLAWAPDWYRSSVRWTVDRPWLVRGVALAEVALGLLWVRRLVRAGAR